MENLIGQQFGYWTVLRYITYTGGKRKCLCQCKCGAIKPVQVGSLKNGSSTKCKTCARKTHGMVYTGVWRAWTNMHQRCTNIKHPQYKDYGGRGVTVCAEWQVFEKFYEDMGDRPKNLSLDRINNDLGYFKDNCKWSTRIEQARNTRMAVPQELYQEIKDSKLSTAKTGKIYNVSHSTIQNIKQRI